MALTSPAPADGESLRSHALGVRWPLLLQAPERPRVANPDVVDDDPTPSQFTWRVILGAKKFTLPGGGLLILSNIAAASLPVIAGAAVDRGIPARQRVAVVGTSGAGKTTLAALIAGIHRPSTGTVDAPTDTMLVSQETHIFSGTLRDNLTLAAPDVTDEDLVTALSRVGAADLLDELPLGLDSPVGAQGHPLTAAQEQHLALTRLLIADPDLAILDEATAEAGSAHAAVLDPAAEVVLQGRTGVVIAHRLSQAAACDRIVLMEQGRVIEDGNHAELVAADGPYSRLWAAWNANTTPHT